MDKRVVAAVVTLLLVAVLITVLAICLAPNKDSSDPFWKRSVIYQVYPRSLSDNLTDGNGDIPGITSKLEYLTQLGVGALWLTPIYPSPMKDGGYDVSDYRGINPLFGNMEDFEKLLKEAHHRGLKVVLDFVPNHSSDQHTWFLKSVQREEPFTDYYVWANASGTNATGHPIPPNNWLCVFHGSAWQWNEDRGQFYYHQFLPEQPDLNFWNPRVKDEMKAVLTYWLDKGVDGFKIDSVDNLYEVQDLSLDEPPATSPPSSGDPEDYGSLDHIYTTEQPENLALIREWRQVLDRYSDRLLIAEDGSNDLDTVMKYYGNSSTPLAHFPLNFFLIKNFPNRTTLTGTALRDTVDQWLGSMPPGMWPNWVLGSHDLPRVGSRMKENLVDGLNMVSLLLPGTPFTYQGEEIGMLDNEDISWEQTVDPSGCRYGPDHYQEHSRDPHRTPFQWDDSEFAGFTRANHTWLPVNSDYTILNVREQLDADHSHLKVYQGLTLLRHKPAHTDGVLAYPFINEDVFSFIRYVNESGSEEEGIVLVLNTAENEVTADLLTSPTTPGLPLPPTASLVLCSITDNTPLGTKMALDNLPLQPGEGMVLSFLPAWD